MSTATDRNYDDYKATEKKALELLAAMKAVSPKKADIELALLVAIFELHKGALPASAVQKIINGHLGVIVPHYAASASGSG
ncbi:hypothetical protein [Synoicihabitans lomoniglobus]|uniref:Uncharacterized protein n=1 Tax=Synoicihabitans lomoniglobus TaxID=2909285 RepID=A0AAF0CQN6_9BACT|nr:hypothetical protein [Opitutaceae bacterium LMO-M01]WED66216.1 hypothetical protein PXH66_05065 [Opitutaceae bacterium LMO-M01]